MFRLTMWNEGRGKKVASRKKQKLFVMGKITKDVHSFSECKITCGRMFRPAFVRKLIAVLLT